MVYLEPKVKAKFKRACFDRDVNMSDIIAELVENWLKANPPAERLPR
ncbi:MAG: hypothetical protein F6K21_05630 [Symploca sp. SIO2D2]|nr:hypothetical protein [Symploca sp. SIO2D2]